MSADPLLVRRFDVGADQAAKGEFARDLIFKLDTLGVKPGAAFMVTTQDQLDAIEKAAEDKVREMDDKLELAERAQAENAHKGELYDALMDMLEDVPRGIRSLEEVMDEAYRNGPE